MKKINLLTIGTLFLLCACSSTPSNSLPTNTTTNPRFNNISVTESRVQAGAIEVFVESLNNTNNIYYVFVDHEATAPTKEQIKKGENYSDVTVLNSGSGVGLVYKTVDSFEEMQWYDFYCVLEDNGTFSEIYYTKVLTLDEENTRDRGEGTLENPYRIETAKDLADVASESYTLNAYYVLMNDIDLSTEYGEGLKSWVPLGAQSGSVKAFNGSFDGQGHTISNLYIDSTSEQTGLFGQLGVDGVISNLTLKDVNIKSTMQRTGAVVGYSKGLVSNINVIGGKVSGTRKVGGAIGDLYEYGYCYKVYTDLEVFGDADDVGGVLGAVDAPTGSTAALEVKNCYSKANVTGTKYTGGVVGYARCMLIDGCYAMGNITGTEGVGGLVGFVQHRADSPIQPIVRNSFALDTMTKGTINAGKVIGNRSATNGGVDVEKVYFYSAKVDTPKENSYSDAVKSFISDGGAWFKTTEELKAWFENTGNINMDFRYTWEIKDGAQRPTLISASTYDNGIRIK